MTLSAQGSTAVMGALRRTHHAEYDEPKIFDDYLAAKLITTDDRTFLERLCATALLELRPDIDVSNVNPRSQVREGLHAIGTEAVMIARARFAEDHLLSYVERGLSQYVILGAGLDTFALRRTDLQERLTVFEIDHPVTQESKRARLAAAGLTCPPNLHFLPVDFERESVAEVLRRSPYRTDSRAFFSWLGVTMYLSLEAVFEVLQSIRSVAMRGSYLVFDYIDRYGFDAAKSSRRMRRMVERTRQAYGEPMISGFDPARLRMDLAQVGFRIVEAIDPEEQQTRYFAGRTDGLHAMEHFHFVLSEVTDSAP
jgi:methyltransferase (TIGR00027 family)